jgi:excinuclease UvrABC ATPase subunit
VLDLPAAAALELFDLPELRRLVEVGLGYLPLGQPLPTLSGGERQRLKLADELGRRDRLYVFDEPTTGLHPLDVDGLVALFERLIENGNSVVVIEHNLDVISQADWIVDLGPGPGRHGGRVLFSGVPVDLTSVPSSHTATQLRRHVGG